MNKTFLNTTIGLCLIGFTIFSACEEAAIPVDGEGTPMKLDTISFPVVKAVSYRTPPEMGNTEYLYFGKKDGYNFQYNLIKFDSSSMTAQTPFSYYNDSLVVVDSLMMSLRFEKDTIENNNPEFQLRYFPDGGDSVFTELESNYFNFDKSSASLVISTARMKTDTTDSNSTKVFLNFMLDTTIMKVFKDTNVTDFNRSFLVELVNEETESFNFISMDKGDQYGPLLTVFYRQFLSDTVVLDTVQRLYNSVGDLSIVVPPEVSDEDTSFLSVGMAMGLKSIVLVDMGDWVLPPKSVVSSAELIFSRAQSDTLENYSVISYLIINEGVYQSFSSFVEDPYKEELNFYTASSVIGNVLKINHRKAATEIGRGKITNYGFKLQTSISNDPFTTVLFHNLNSSDSYPVMRVIYVLP